MCRGGSPPPNLARQRGTKSGTPKEPRPFQIKNKIEKQFTNEKKHTQTNKETQKNITTSNTFEPERVNHKENTQEETHVPRKISPGSRHQRQTRRIGFWKGLCPDITDIQEDT